MGKIKRIDDPGDPQPRFPAGLKTADYLAITYRTDHGVFILFPFTGEPFATYAGSLQREMMQHLHEMIRRCFDVNDGSDGVGIGTLIEDPDDRPQKCEFTQNLWREFMREQHSGRTIQQVLARVNTKYRLPLDPLEYFGAVG